MFSATPVKHDVVPAVVPPAVGNVVPIESKIFLSTVSDVVGPCGTTIICELVSLGGPIR